MSNALQWITNFHPASPLPAGGGPALLPRERALLEACAEVLFPAAAGGVSGRDAGTVPYFEEFVRGTPGATRMLIRALLLFIHCTPVLYGGKPRPFTELTRADQRRVLRALMNSKVYLFRTAFLSLRTALTLAYFSSRRVNSMFGTTPDTNPFGLAQP